MIFTNFVTNSFLFLNSKTRIKILQQFGGLVIKKYFIYFVYSETRSTSEACRIQ